MRWPLLLTGKTGTGKTCLAGLIFERFPDMEQPMGGGECYWVNATDGLRAMVCSQVEHQRFFGMPQGVPTRYFDHLNAARECGLLVLDDLGARKPSEAVQEVVLALINARAGKPFIVTTNLGMKELAANYDDRVVDRLGEGTVLEFSGKSRRTGQ